MSNTMSDTSKESVEDIFDAGREYQRRIDARGILGIHDALDDGRQQELADCAQRLMDEQRSTS
jgi:hypothetical protein